jgi:hypothetical protein
MLNRDALAQPLSPRDRLHGAEKRLLQDLIVGDLENAPVLGARACRAQCAVRTSIGIELDGHAGDERQGLPSRTGDSATAQIKLKLTLRKSPWFFGMVRGLEMTSPPLARTSPSLARAPRVPHSPPTSPHPPTAPPPTSAPGTLPPPSSRQTKTTRRSKHDRATPRFLATAPAGPPRFVPPRAFEWSSRVIPALHRNGSGAPTGMPGSDPFINA